MRCILAVICSIGLAAGVTSCGIEKPQLPEGRNGLTLVALDTSGIYGDAWRGVPGAVVEITSSTFVYQERFVTDEDGRLSLEGLPSGDYTVQVSLKDEISNVLLLGQAKEQLDNAKALEDTVFMSFVSISPIVLNEIYFAGCNAGSFYFYDQFIELYNATNDTLYLDGYIMCRSTQVENIIDLEKEDYALAYYVYQFPGIRDVTRQCPIAPHDFLVIAGDAINHNLYGPLCVDLNAADWEFFNAVSNDYDNLAVPNLTPISTTGVDFTFNLMHCALWLATGEEYTFQEHCYMSGTSLICSPYVHIPLSTIIDGVEYSSNPASPRYMTIRIDAGLGGNGVTRYSGQSIERKVPGLDSNNSSFDFEALAHPTPGYSHSR
jgi:hypothetical protein